MTGRAGAHGTATISKFLTVTARVFQNGTLPALLSIFSGTRKSKWLAGTPVQAGSISITCGCCKNDPSMGPSGRPGAGPSGRRCSGWELPENLTRTRCLSQSRHGDPEAFPSISTAAGSAGAHAKYLGRGRTSQVIDRAQLLFLNPLYKAFPGLSKAPVVVGMHNVAATRG